jgi:perosamine synthetase
MQAALGYAQTERLDELMAAKRKAFSWYQERLAGLPGVALNNPGPDVEASYWMISIVWDKEFGIAKKSLRESLLAHGIDSRPFFSPLSSLAAYQNLPDIGKCRQRNPVSYSIADHGINLPSSLVLQEDDADHVCSVVRTLFSSLS